MALKIVAPDANRTTFHKDVELDLRRDTAILIRQSRRGSHIVHYESRLLQESLIPFVMEARGESDLAHIRIFDEGSGVSGRKGIDKRGHLRQLHEDVTNNLIGDIVVARVDRLFRDKHFANVAVFTELAEKMGIKVIVPASSGVIVYDIKQTDGLQRFQSDMQKAYAYVDNQIGYMNRARDYKMSRGLYGGGCLPLPYVLLRDMPKEEQVPVIYHPWKETAINLFEKFTEFNFEIGRMARFVEEKAFIFPFMSDEDLKIYKPVTNMKKVDQGYTFSSPKTLLQYLSNLVLAGFAHAGRNALGDTILIDGAFETAVPLELLEPSYAAIKGEYLDGTPFEKTTSRRQFRRDNIETDAILHGLLTSSDGAISVYAQLEDDYPIYACLRGGYNGQKTRFGLGRVLKAWTLPCKEVDRVILDRLVALSEFDQNMVERIKAYFANVSSDGRTRLEVLDMAIHKTQQALRRISKTIVMLTKSDGEEQELDPNDPIIKEHRSLTATLRNLQKQRAEAAIEVQEDPAASIENFYGVLSHLRAEFNRKAPQTKKDIIRKLVESVEVSAISAHLYTLRITWIRPLSSYRDDVALLWRSDPTRDNGKSSWSEEEERMLKTLYPSSQQLEIMQAIPNKTPGQIKKRASELEIRRDYVITNSQHTRYHWTVRYKDLEEVSKFTSSEEEKAFLWGEINTMARASQRGKLSVSWFLPIDMISFANCLEDTRGIEDTLPRISA